MYRLNCLRLIRVAGADRASFLQGQLTQDVVAASPTLSTLCGWTTARGRLLLIGQLFDWQDSYWLTAPAATADALVSRLRMFILRAKVTVEVSEMVVAGLPGTEAANDLGVDDTRLAAAPLAAYAAGDWLAARVAGDPARVFITAEPGVADRLLSRITSHAHNDASWRLADIHAGLPQIQPETSDTFVPQMVNLDLIGGVSFRKGCYVGQEIVARARHLGRIKRRMLRFRCTAPIQAAPGAAIFGPQRPAGVVVSAGQAPEGTELLAVTQLDEAGGPMFADEARRLELIRLDLPYSIPELSTA
jgi:folate-binding protein YgfZ